MTFHNYENWRSTLKIFNNHRNTYLTISFVIFVRLRTYSILSSPVNGLVLHLSCYVLLPLYRALVPEVDQRRGLYSKNSLLTGCYCGQTNLREKIQNNRIIIISKSRFGSISISSALSFCSLTFKHRISVCNGLYEYDSILIEGLAVNLQVWGLHVQKNSLPLADRCQNSRIP